MKINFCRAVAFLVLFSVIPLPSTADSSKKEIVFKNVMTDKPCKEAKGYVCGADMYPDFASSGLPPTFGINRKAGLIIPVKGITGAKIIKQQLGKWENWQVEIKFSPEYGKRMEEYTANKKDGLMAMEIGGKVAAIAPLFSPPLGNEITITSTKDRIEKIGNLLRTIYPQITMETQTSSSNTPVHQDAAKPRR